MARAKRVLDPKTVEYIKSRIREVWSWDKERKKAKQRALIRKEGDVEFWKCEKCGANPLTARQRDIDHNEPVEPVNKTEEDWNRYLERMFVWSEELTVLCKPCHKVKTGCENSKRARKPRKAL